MRRLKRRKNNKNLQLTDNSKEYKMTKRRMDLGCPICGPNRGCNRNRDNDFRNWKRYRKTQWRE